MSQRILHEILDNCLNAIILTRTNKTISKASDESNSKKEASSQQGPKIQTKLTTQISFLEDSVANCELHGVALSSSNYARAVLKPYCVVKLVE